MRKVMFWSPCIYLFIYLYACYSHNTKRIKPNRMKFGGMIGYYPGTIWLDFGIDRVKGQRSRSMSWKGQHILESHAIWWDDWLLSGDHFIRFWDQSGQGHGHEKVKIFFFIQLACNYAKMFIIQCPIVWYAKVCALPSAHSSFYLDSAHQFTSWKEQHMLCSPTASRPAFELTDPQNNSFQKYRKANKSQVDSGRTVDTKWCRRTDSGWNGAERTSSSKRRWGPREAATKPGRRVKQEDDVEC